MAAVLKLPPADAARSRLAEVLERLDAAIRDAAPEDRPGLVVALSARLATLGARMATATATSGNGHAEPGDRNLSAREAARRLGVSKPYLYKHADEYPFTRRIGARVLFSEQGLDAWNRGRRPLLTVGTLEG